MSLKRLRFKLRKALAEHGMRGTLALLTSKGLRPSVGAAGQPKEYTEVHPFDRHYAVETSGFIKPEELISHSGRSDLYNAGYFSVAPSAFRSMLERLQPRFEEYTFVDLGAGKGRAMLIASEYPFRAICGVEISPALHAIAAKNIESYCNPKQKCRNISAVLGDATCFPFPAGPLLVYMWNPFEGPVFHAVLKNLEESLQRTPRDILVLYVQPNQEHLLTASQHWRELWHHDFEMSDEDYAACAFPIRAEPCTAFRSVIPTGSVPQDENPDGHEAPATAKPK